VATLIYLPCLSLLPCDDTYMHCSCTLPYPSLSFTSHPSCTSAQISYPFHMALARAPPLLMEVHKRNTVKFRKVANYSCSSCLPIYVCFLSWLELPVIPPVSLYLFASAKPPFWSLSTTLAMESSSNSSTPPNPSPSLELEICRLKHTLSVHRGFFLSLDREGGQMF
jgi:hypothetical protein